MVPKPYYPEFGKSFNLYSTFLTTNSSYNTLPTNRAVQVDWECKSDTRCFFLFVALYAVFLIYTPKLCKTTASIKHYLL